MKKVIIFLLNLWYVFGFTFYLIYGYWCFWRTVQIRNKKGEQAADAFLRPKAKNFGRRAFTWLTMRPKLYHADRLPKDTPYLLVCNHQSYYDIPLVLGFIEPRASFIGKKEVRSLPLMGKGLDLLGGVFIDRDNPQQAVGVLRTVFAGLKKGKVYALFPEGTRSKDGKMGVFKKGSLRIGLMAKVPIYPAVIDGTKDVVSKGKLFIRPSRVTVHILEEVDPSAYRNEDDLIQTVYESMTAMLENRKRI